MMDQRNIVVLADQVGSQRSPDAVPAALAALAEIPAVLAFERTAGDEIQGLVPDGAAAVAAVTRLWRIGRWSIGLGIGAVEEPLPASTREARGPAYVAARRAIEEAATVTARLRIVCEPVDSSKQADLPDADPASSSSPINSISSAEHAETVLWLAEPLIRARSEATWEALDLADDGLSQKEIGVRLGITQGAVSRRLSRAFQPECERASVLAATLLDMAQGGTSGGAD